MKIKSKKTAAIALAAVMSLGMFAGCDNVIRNNKKNMNQTVATVNITDSDTFKSEFSLSEEITQKVISTASVSKRDLILMFVVSGYSQYLSYGYTYEDLFNRISEMLVQRQIYVQYAKSYFLKNGWTDEDGKEYTYNDLAKFNAAVKDKEGIDYDIATLQYFLTEEESLKVDYTTRVMFNNSIDSYEDKYIEEQEEENDEYDSDVRTTPTGIETTDPDYYDEYYRIYTGTGKQNGVYGSYETKDGSTATTRLRAYNEFIKDLRGNNLIQKGEDTSDIESLEYFKMERKRDYEDALLKKLTDTFADEAESQVDEQYCKEQFDKILKAQYEDYSTSHSNLESAMDSISDTSFVLTATGNSKEESAYGFVINILLPFSAAQSDALKEEKQDFGDTKGNNFMARARLLERVKATDQRGSWFRGETDYSFKSTDGFTNNDDTRQWLFFEDYLKEGNVEYKRLSNYLGKYTYNGTWDEETRKYKPNSITIDGFIKEMEGYLDSVMENGFEKAKFTAGPGDAYYKKSVNQYYNEDGTVDYSQFVYYENAVNFSGGFNANNMFKKGSPENNAFSVINELSFAYNTDTAGLNSYLGYAVTANKTNFVSEFEYAAQQVVLKGAGNYIVVPSDYGWHIIYCTFSFVDSKEAGAGGIRTPFEYDHTQRTEEGTFSYLFYESVKTDTATSKSSNRLEKIVAAFKDSYTIFNERFKDLTNLG